MLSLPFMRSIVIYKPGEKKEARIINLTLCVCKSCKQKRKSVNFQHKYSKEDFMKHPAVNLAIDIGYTNLMCPDELSKWK